jgi:MFS family permease
MPERERTGATAEAQEPQARHLGHRIFSAFETPAFRRYTISFGFQNQEIVRAWLAYSLHRSAADVGLVVLASAVAQVAGAPIGGIVADRFDRRRVMVSMQTVSFIASALVGVLVIADVIRIWHLVLLAIVTGGATSLHMPSRHSIMFDIVGKRHLSNALAINAGMMSGMRLIAPAVAGLVINYAGIGPAYFLSVFSYAVSLATLSFVVPKVEKRTEVKRESPQRAYLEGIRYLFRNRQLFWLYIFSSVTLLIAAPFREMLSPFADKQLHGDADTFGLILSLTGVGAILGSVAMAAFSGFSKKALLMFCGAASWGLLLVAMAYVPNFGTGVPVFITIGFAQAIFTTCVSILMQSNVEDAYRGRMLSFHLISYSMPGVSALAIGHVVDAQGVQAAFVGIGAALLLFVAAMSVWRKDIRALR